MQNINQKTYILSPQSPFYLLLAARFYQVQFNPQLMTYKISTFNVLHDLQKHFSPILQPAKRFSYIIDQILNSSSDIYCLNEVTTSLWPIIVQKLSSKYPYMSKPIIKSRKISVVILSKTPLRILYQLESLVIAYTNNMIIVSAHFTAYEQKYQYRQNQLLKITQKLKEIQNVSLEKELRQTFEKKNIIILGDLNLHLINETLMIYRQGYYDAWIEIHKGNEGYTWDPKQNKMIGWFLPFDNRRMRLDRILVKQNSNIKVEDINIDFRNQIPGTFFLYPSDHFGLTMRFNITSGPVSTDHESILSKIPNKRATGFRPMKKIMRYRKLSCLVLVILLIVFLAKYVF